MRIFLNLPLRSSNDPIAIIELAQMVRIEAIPQIGREPNTPRGRRMRQSSEDRPKAICVFPCDFGPLFQLEHAHSFRLKYNMLAVIQLPVSRQDASFALQPLVQSRVGEGSHDCKTRQVDFRGDCEFRRFHKNVGVISIQTKNKTSLQGDSMIVKLLNNLYEPIRGIKSLSAGPQVFLRDGFQP